MGINKGISIARIAGMVMIIFCHLFAWLGIPAPSQLLNVGIFVFLIISGFLYSNKEIEYPGRWLINRWKKLNIPMLIWLFIVVLVDVTIYKVTPGIIECVLFLLNLQGIGWIIKSIPTIGNMGGYWEASATLGF